MTARTPLFSWMRKMVAQAMAEQAEQTLPPEGANPYLSRDLTRRDFLKASLGAAGALSMVGLSAHAQPDSRLKPRKESAGPVVIVGAGLAGLVTAYRLMQRNIPCEIYEASGRLGGRVHTRTHFNQENMFVELGGELVDTVHEDLITLCQELNVPLERFDTEPQAMMPAIYFSEGQVRTEAEVLAAFKPLAESLAADIRKCFPDGEIEIPTYQQPYNAAWLDHMSLAQYLDSKQNVASWLIRLIKTAYLGEYGLEPEEQSALNLLLLIGTDTQNGFRIFGESDEAMRIQGGNSQLVQAIAQAIQAKVPIHSGYRLVQLAEAQGTLRLSFKKEGITKRVDAERAVLAIPFSVLREVDGLKRLSLSPVKQRCIREWSYGTNSKQMMGFHSRYWRESHPQMPACNGEFFTDLETQGYWETSRLQKGQAGILTNFLGGHAGRNATSRQWQKALNALDGLYQGLAEDQFDGNRAFFNWSRNPLVRGSYTCPRPGQYTTLMGAAHEPELGGHLFFAGEHCSLNWAGFMNGAVESGNVAATQLAEQLAVMPISRLTQEAAVLAPA